MSNLDNIRATLVSEEFKKRFYENLVEEARQTNTG
jgi:hypothetical protein